MKKLLYIAFAAALLFCALVLVCKWGTNPHFYQNTAGTAGESAYTLVIDAGHGGEDGGAVAPDGTLESTLNLSVANRLRALCELFGVSYVMTRDGEQIDYPPEATTVKARKTADQKARAELAADTENAILISIHQNKYTDAAPHGAQTLYSARTDSAYLAETLQSILLSQVDTTGSRKAVEAGEDLYLLNHVPCPAILLECGFLSNPEELSRLQTDGYQTKLSLALISAYLCTFETTEETTYG